jgi:hypothetical protein
MEVAGFSNIIERYPELFGRVGRTFGGTSSLRRQDKIYVPYSFLT